MPSPQIAIEGEGGFVSSIHPSMLQFRRKLASRVRQRIHTRKKVKSELVLLRHGQSIWNKENRFTGWTDVDLTPKGIEEGERSARLLHEQGFHFDVAFTSVLRRAVRTLWIVLDELDLMWLPVLRDWRLNERHYGALQGHSKECMAKQMGEETVHQWRRGYQVRPPALTLDDPRHPRFDPRYRYIDPLILPRSESLHDTLLRVLPCWRESITPHLRAGKRVLIVAHHNSLRALVKYLDQIPESEIPRLNIPTGFPLVYDLDEELRPVSKRYLGDPQEVKAAAAAVYRFPHSIRDQSR